MLTLDFAAKKRKRKKRNCEKGYPCGNSCIQKKRKCKRKFSDQASTYAGWLKKQGKKTVDDSKGTRKKLNTLVDKAVDKVDSKKVKDTHEMTQKEWVKKVVGNRPKKDPADILAAIEQGKKVKKIGNIVIEDLDNSKRYHVGEFTRNQLDNQSPGMALPNSNELFEVSGNLVQPGTKPITSRDSLIEAHKKGRLNITFKGLNQTSSSGTELLKADGRSSLKKDHDLQVRIAKDTHEEALRREIKNGVKISDKVLKDYPELKKANEGKDPNRQNPGESIQDFIKRRNQDPEVQKRQAERDRARSSNGRLPDAPIGTVGTSGLGGKRRRRKKK